MRGFLSALYAVNFAAGTALSIRRDIPARPFGLETGLGVREDTILGFGSGLAAPWPMIALLLRSRLRHEPASVLWSAFLIGALSEPITYRAVFGKAPGAESAVVALNIVVPLMVLAGRAGRQSAAT